MIAKRGWNIARLGLLTVALVLAVTFVCQAATVTGFTVQKNEAAEKVEIHVNAAGPVDYRVLSTNTPRQALVVEMSPATVVGKAEKTVPINMGIVERAKLSKYRDGVVRLTVDVLQPAKYYVEAAPGKEGFTLILNTQTVAAKAPKAAPVATAPEKPVQRVSTPVSTPKRVAQRSTPVRVATPPQACPPTPTTAPYKHRNVRAAAKPARPRVRTQPVKLVSIDFVNADLIYVLKLLAKELGTNLVTDSTVTGSVTMSLKNVSAQTAINIIVRMNGFQMKKLGNILFIGSAETINAIGPDVIAYQPSGNVRSIAIRLENIPASDAVTAVKNAYPLVDVRQGGDRVVIVAANPSLLNEIRSLVKGIDVAPGPAPIVQEEKIEVVRLKYAAAKDIVLTLKNLLGTDAPANMEVDDRLNAIIFKGYETQIDRAKAQLAEIDIPLQQVMLSVKVVDLSESGAKNIGITWAVGSGENAANPVNWSEVPAPGSAGPGSYAPGSPSTWNPGGAVPANPIPVPIGYFVRSPFVLSTAISMQITQGEARVLASPRVAALSGKEATIHIGDKYPIVYYDPRAGQYQVIYVDIGIKLKVKPTISPDGYITTDIDTTVSDLRELINNQYPRTTERSANLTIRVKDNNTIVIGGMVNEASRSNVIKVPLLGDIPVIGAFFRNTTVDRSKGEVVIMITPKIITQ